MPPEMPKAAIWSGRCGWPADNRRRSSAAIMFWRPARLAPPASARNSRWRENHMTMMLARMPSTTWAKMEVIQNAGPWPRSVLNTTRSTTWPITRDRKITKVFTTPGSGPG
jgi:hypothetical protein